MLLQPLWCCGLLLLFAGCSGAPFEAAGLAEAAGMAGVAGIAGVAAGIGGAAGAPEAGGRGGASVGGSTAGNAGATMGGSSVGGMASTGGASHAGAGGASPTCSPPDLNNRLPSVMTWHDFDVQIGTWCGRCRDTPCHTIEIDWRYPIEMINATTVRAWVQVSTTTLVAYQSGSCGAETVNCSSGIGGSAWLDLHLVPTPTGWKIGSVQRYWSDPSMADASFFSADPGSCDPGEYWQDKTGTIRDDLYSEFKTLLMSSSWSCP